MSAARVISRLSVGLPSISLKSVSPSVSPLKSTFRCQVSASAKRISGISRLPVELSCLVSMMPLHSAIASARLTSALSIDSQSWGLIPQGISMPL